MVFGNFCADQNATVDWILLLVEHRILHVVHECGYKSMKPILATLVFLFSALWCSTLIWAEEVTTTAPIENKSWWWSWLIIAGMAVVVAVICFKNPKRAHNN